MLLDRWRQPVSRDLLLLGSSLVVPKRNFRLALGSSHRLTRFIVAQMANVTFDTSCARAVL